MRSKVFQSNLSSFLFAAVFGLASTANAGIFAEIDTEMSPNTDEVSSVTYINYTMKVNDRYGLSAETRNDLTYRTGGEGKFKLDHIYTRLLLSDKNLAKLGSWTLENTYRYTLPTTMGLQQDGALGVVTMRPGLKAEFGKFSMYGRYGMSFYLQRRAFQENGTGKSTKYYSGSLELFPTINITDAISVYYYLTLSHIHFYSKRLPTDKKYQVLFGHQPTIEFSPKSWNGAMLGFYFSHETEIGNGADATFASKDGSRFGVEMAKAS